MSLPSIISFYCRSVFFRFRQVILKRKLLIASVTIGINITVVHLNQGLGITMPQCQPNKFFASMCDSFPDIIFLIFVHFHLRDHWNISLPWYKTVVHLAYSPHYTLLWHLDDFACSAYRLSRLIPINSINSKIFILFGFATCLSFRILIPAILALIPLVLSYDHFYAPLCSHILNILVP